MNMEKNKLTIKKPVKKITVESKLSEKIQNDSVKKNKKTLTGIVISDKMKNTVVVLIERRVTHPVYRKIIKKTKKMKADTNGMIVVAGQTVKIESTRPISRGKYFKVIEIMKEGKNGTA